MWQATRRTTASAKPPRFQSRSMKRRICLSPERSWPYDVIRPSGSCRVVAEYGRRHEQIVRAGAGPHVGEGVDGVERVGPHVALGVPARELLAVDERRQFGVVAEPAAVAEEGEAEGRAAAVQQQLLPFAGQAFAGQIFLGHRRADGDRLRGDGEDEARGELHGAEHAQGVFGEVRAHVAQDVCVDVGQAVEGVHDLAVERIEEDGVDGEVAPGAGLVEGEVGHGVDEEPAVPRCGLALASRQGDVDGESGELEHAEARADGIEAEGGLQQGLETVGGDAVDFDVEVLGRAAHGGVAHAAADEDGAAAGGLDDAGDFPGGVGVAPGGQAGVEDGGEISHRSVSEMGCGGYRRQRAA